MIVNHRYDISNDLIFRLDMHYTLVSYVKSLYSLTNV